MVEELTPIVGIPIALPGVLAKALRDWRCTTSHNSIRLN